MKSNSSLGKGLSALLGENMFSDETGYSYPAQNQAMHLSLSIIRPGKYQPRRRFDDEKLDSLMRSIKEKGIIQPLILRSLQSDPSCYEIIAGERRWRAAKLLGLETVPVIIQECNDSEALETAIIENVQRDDLSPIEEAEAYLRLMNEFNYTQEQLAKVIGKSRSYLANTLRLNHLPESVKELVHSGKISAGHARTLVNRDNIDELVNRILDDNLTVREAEKLTTRPAAEKTLHIPKTETEVQTQVLEEQIAQFLELKVSLKIKQNGGVLSIFFNSYEEMDELVEKMRQMG